MLRVELAKLVRRPRTWITIALLVGLPTVIAVFVHVTGIGPRPGEGPALLSEVLNNGLLLPAAALALILPVFLPVAVAVIAGDAVAGEAATGTLRYLLVRPVPRTRLLVSKLLTIIFFILLAVTLVAGISLAVGWGLFGVKPLTSVSGSSISTADTVWRTILTIAYVATSMLGLGAIALFASTRTDSPLAAALAALAAFITSQILDLIDATQAIQPYLPTHYWLSFIDLYRDPVLWHDIERGFALQGLYIVVFLLAAWASFSRKDITS